MYYLYVAKIQQTAESKMSVCNNFSKAKAKISLRYCPPIPVLHVLYCAQAFPHYPETRVFVCGVGIDDIAGYLPYILQQLFVACKVGYLQVKGYTALLCAFHVAWTA